MCHTLETGRARFTRTSVSVEGRRGSGIGVNMSSRSDVVHVAGGVAVERVAVEHCLVGPTGGAQCQERPPPHADAAEGRLFRGRRREQHFWYVLHRALVFRHP